MNIISVNNLSKLYQGRIGITNVTFQIEKGEFAGIVGHNGSGKTTLLNLICGLIKPTHGSVELFGDKMINIKNISNQIGVVLQYSGLPDLLTVREYLRLECGLYGIGQSQLQEGLDLVRLSNCQNIKISELSEGSKRKLVIMKTLLRKPPLLIMDEPTAGIDPVVRYEIWEYLRDIKRHTEVTTIISTNDLFEVENLCDRILFLRNGQLIKNEIMAELLKNDLMSKVLYISFPEEVGSFDGIADCIWKSKADTDIKDISDAGNRIRISLRGGDPYGTLLIALEALIANGYRFSSVSFGESSLDNVLIANY